MFELLNQQLRAGRKEFNGEFFQKLTAYDGAANDYFGYSVSASGDGSMIAVGTHRDDDKGTNSGSVYIFTKQVNGSYLQTQKLIASDGSAYDFFGYSVSVSGDASVIAIGALYDDDKGDASGSVYIFTKQAGGSYAQTQKLMASDGAAGDYFGQSVSVSSDGLVIVVGAYYDDDKGENSGSVYIFTKQVNGSYLQTQKLTALDGLADDLFGFSVSASADTSMIVIGAYGDDDYKGANSGSAYVFTKQVNGSYSQFQKLTVSDGGAIDSFGFSSSVSSDGSVIVIGAYLNDSKGADSGSAYIFTKQVDGNYSQLQKLTASDGAAGDQFGISVTVSTDGSVVFIGSYLDDDKGDASGSVYIFTKQADGSYAQTHKLTASDGAVGGSFGRSLAVSGDGSVTVIGAYGDDDKGIGSGSVYVFK